MVSSAGGDAQHRQFRRLLVTRVFASIALSLLAQYETAGLFKVLIDPATERILGASLVGAEVGELVHILATLMQAGASARAIVDVEMAHPTFAEGLQSAVMQLERFALH